MITTTVTHERPDELRRESWRFWLNSHHLVLDRWEVAERPSRRHKYRVAHGYSRLDRCAGDTDKQAAPLPDWVCEQAVAQLAASITVTKELWP